MRRRYQSMTPEAADSLTNSQRPQKACAENPVQVEGHQPQEVYMNNPITITHQDISKAIAAPITPKSRT
jgi:hypothetical protein